MDKEKTCFNCKFQPLCYKYKRIFELHIMDTCAKEYETNFKTLYMTIGNICKDIKKDK